MLVKAVTAATLGALALSTVASAQEEQASEQDPVVAIVDGTEIHLSEIEDARRTLPQQYSQVPLPMIFEPLLNRVIDARLLAEEADRVDLDEAPEVQPALAQARAQVLRDALVERRVQEGTTEEKLRARYEELKESEDFQRQEVRARHILLPTEEEAQDVIEQLEGGGDFAELAQEESTGPSAEQGGDLGYFTREQMVPEFAEVAFDLETGEVTDEPVQTQFGWHVIKALDKRSREPSFEEMEPQLRQDLAREIVTALVTDLREDAEIERFSMDGSPATEAEPAEGQGQPQPQQ